MKILGIDTSCDDTCVSIVKIQNPKSPPDFACERTRWRAGKIQNFEIISDEVSSQVKLHAKYGGVFPSLAKREHQRNLPVVFAKALQDTRYKIQDLDFVAVTSGPGLEPCLWQGINFAKEIAKKYKKPLIPVNHIEAHILANWLNSKSRGPVKRVQNSKLFPAVCLVVSGGHTQLILMKDIIKYKLIGETRDDAAGECFDKVARILCLGYPGGPAIAAAAAKMVGRRVSDQLPRPMMYTKDYDFSFSGLKTAVLYRTKQGNYDPAPFTQQKVRGYDKIEMCREIQQAIIDVLIHKTIKAAKDFGVKSIILGGGVAANTELREQFKSKIQNTKSKINFFVPPKNLCTDNAAMVAVTAYFHRMEKFRDIKAEANLRI